MPWWGWLLLCLWAAPGVYCAFALLLMKPIGGLDENGERYKPTPVFRKMMLFPLALVVLVILWPCVFWADYRHSRR